MLNSSEEHREYQRANVQGYMGDALSEIADESVFSPDQIALLQKAFWKILHAINSTT